MRRNITGIILGILVSIPIIICKIKVSNQPDTNVRELSDHEADVLISQNCTETETPTIEEIIKDTIKVPEIVTEEVTEPVFSGYEFIPLDKELQAQIYDLCEQYEIAYDLVLSIIKTESEFQVDVIGDNGQAIGLCQIWPRWWQGVADSHCLDIYNPKDNVELMLIILTSHLDVCNGDLTGALQIYNTGKPYGDTYANRVYANYQWILSEV